MELRRARERKTQEMKRKIKCKILEFCVDALHFSTMLDLNFLEVNLNEILFVKNFFLYSFFPLPFCFHTLELCPGHIRFLLKDF